MSEINITVEGGTSKRLLTAGKYCDRDIVVTATGGGGGITPDDIANCTITGDMALTAAKINAGAFWGNSGITSVTAPNATSIGDYALRNCSKVAYIDAPEVVSIGSYALSGCSGLATMHFPKLETVGTYAFTGCSNVQGAIVLPKVTKLPTQSCYNMNDITSLDLPVCTSIADQTLRYCEKLSTLILRSTTLCTLGNINTFYNTPFASGKSGGKLYVPAALVGSYQTASKWSTIYGYGTNEFRALEDYTVDGTITGELDESKI